MSVGISVQLSCKCVTYLSFAPALLPDVQSDSVSLFLGAQQIHVVSDEEFPSSGDCCAPRRDKRGRTEIWSPLALLQLRE